MAPGGSRDHDVDQAAASYSAPTRASAPSSRQRDDFSARSRQRDGGAAAVAGPGQRSACLMWVKMARGDKGYGSSRAIEEATMQVPVQITFRHMDPNTSARAQVEQRVAELEQFYDRITACQVVLEASGRQHRQGNIFHVRIDLTVPGRSISVGRDPAGHHAHEDAHVAIRDAFDAARRQLEDHVRRMGGATKTHAEAPVGRITKLFPERGYAFLTTAEGDDA